MEVNAEHSLEQTLEDGGTILKECTRVYWPRRVEQIQNRKVEQTSLEERSSRVQDKHTGEEGTTLSSTLSANSKHDVCARSCRKRRE
jgi:hypothetical protein